MSQICDLVFRYLHKKLAASGNTPATITASGGTVRTAISAALTEADDYWNGAIVKWTVGLNAGLYSSVKDFDAASDTLTFDDDLPNAVVNTDQFILFHGGKHASDQNIPALTAAAPVNITGFTIALVGMINGVGTGALTFYYNGGSGQGITWTPPGGTEGAQIDVSALANGDKIMIPGGGAGSDDKSKFIQLQRTAAAMPTADELDDIVLTSPTGSFLGAIMGADASGGVTFYRPVAIKNTAAGKVYGVKAFCPQPFSGAAATTIATGGGIGTGADTLTADDLTSWGTHGFVYNSTKDDLRYYYDRSGNTVQVLGPGGGIRDFAAQSWDDGDDIEPFPWMDIGLDAPGAASVFEDPATENTAPTGVTFSAPLDEASALVIGDLDAGGVYCIWERFYIPAGFQPLNLGAADLWLYAEVTG